MVHFSSFRVNQESRKIVPNPHEDIWRLNNKLTGDIIEKRLKENRFTK